MNFKGHDYGELLDAFGIRETYDRLIADDGLDEDVDLDEEMIVRYIKSHTLFGGSGICSIEEGVRGHMVDFLYALSNSEWCNDGDKFMLRSVLALSYRSDDFAFYRWFIHCLPLMWT